MFVTTSALANNVTVLNNVSKKTAVYIGSKLKIDTESGLKIAVGWDVVKKNCTSCHSAKIIISQQGNRQTWLAIIRWMQDKQGLRKISPKTEKSILGYLVNNYPPLAMSRRENLPAEALPTNPWSKRSRLKQKKFKVIVLKKR